MQLAIHPHMPGGYNLVGLPIWNYYYSYKWKYPDKEALTLCA